MATGDTLLTFMALDNSPPDDTIATLDSILTTSADEPDDVVLVLDFDPGATQEYAAFSSILPAAYAGGGLTVDVYWMTESVTASEVCKWDVQIKRLNAGANLLTKVYAAEQTASDNPETTARLMIKTSITFTSGAQMDSLAADEPFSLQITRDGADAADTMNSNDAELYAIVISET